MPYTTSSTGLEGRFKALFIRVLEVAPFGRLPLP